MDKAHDIEEITFSGETMFLCVDGRKYKLDISAISEKLAKASEGEREKFELSPSGYGIHWPDLDEDLSIDGLIGIKHAFPMAEVQR